MRFLIFTILMCLSLTSLAGEQNKVCSNLMEADALNVKQVCIGDDVSDGKIVGIEKSSSGPTRFKVKVGNTNLVRSDVSVVLKNPGTCAKKNETSFCIGQSYITSEGKRSVVTGFLTPQPETKEFFVVSLNSETQKVSYDPIDYVSDQFKATQTGLIKANGICYQSSKAKKQNLVEECAKRDLQSMAVTLCNQFRLGNGSIKLDLNSKEIITKCQSSQDADARLYCRADAYVKCEYSEPGVLKKIGHYMNELFESNSNLHKLHSSEDIKILDSGRGGINKASEIPEKNIDTSSKTISR